MNSYIDPIKIMMDNIIAKTEVAIEAGYQDDSILHIKIDPEEILEKIPKFIEAVYKAKGQYDGLHTVLGERPDKVIIYFDGHKYEAKAEYKEVIDTQFKGYSHE